MENRIAIVTGAVGGIGVEICKILQSRSVKLILVDRNLEKSKSFAEELNLRSQDSALECFAVDLTNHADIARVTRLIKSKYPRIDYLFNNAGVLTETMQFSGHGNELHFEVNTLGSLGFIDGLRESLAQSGRGMVIGTSAGIALKVSNLSLALLTRPTTFRKLYGPYVNSKQALNVLTQALSREMADQHILLRTADPGPVKTRLTQGAGTPLWMRMFAFLLPSPSKGALKIVNAALDPRWGDQSGICISGNRIHTLPPEISSPKWQSEFLAQCREMAKAL